MHTFRDVCAWRDLGWSELTRREQGLWAALGWTKTSWESDTDADTPPSDDTKWVNLSGKHRAAAHGLGFGPKTWDHDHCTSNDDDDWDDSDF